jgi:hypothetical protein
MPASMKKSDTELVSEHITRLDDAVRDTVQYVRETILSASTLISERIKWNNPSFYYHGPLKKEDPKKYPRELAVFNLFKNRMMLVIPHGARVDDGSGLLSGGYVDGRRIIVFKDLADAKKKKKALQSMVKAWLSDVDA